MLQYKQRHVPSPLARGYRGYAVILNLTSKIYKMVGESCRHEKRAFLVSSHLILSHG